jgi:hypothetical protein
VEITGTTVQVKIVGPAHSIIECSQQFAWLASAFCVVKCETSSVNCSLHIIYISGMEPGFELALVNEFSCHIVFRGSEPVVVKPVVDTALVHYWHAMFVSQVMLVGFPTFEKHESGTGLKMPLKMMVLFWERIVRLPWTANSS